MRTHTTMLLFAALLLVALGSGFAQAQQESETKIPPPEFTLSFETFVLFKNDNDFDRTDPIYSDNGQSVGYVSTVFEPAITWKPILPVKIHYALELGDNIWSRNDSDQQDPTAPDQVLVKHKEFWSQVLFPGNVAGFTAGYQYLFDPTHLFLDRYMGAFELFAKWGDNRIALWAGQIPDSVYEGVNAVTAQSELAENNFENDDYLFALSASFMREDITINPGLFFRWNKNELRRPEGLLAPVINLEGRFCPRTSFSVDLAGMWGRHLRAGLDNRDVERLAGAAQIGLAVNARPVLFDWNLLALTADDGDRYDQYDTGFAFSGWSKSRTLLLSENWLRDQYDNLDERAAAQRAGLFLIDQDMSFALTQEWKLITLAGFGMVLDDTHTGGESILGTEVDGGIEWALYQRHVIFTLLGGALFPGGAGAVLQNEIDLENRHTQFHGQGSMRVVF